MKLDYYTGSALLVDLEDGKLVVSMLPVRREFEYHGVQCTRRQLPNNGSQNPGVGIGTDRYRSQLARIYD